MLRQDLRIAKVPSKGRPTSLRV